MKHFLIIKESHFFDPHGTPDAGSIQKFISTNERYQLLDGHAYYGSDWNIETLMKDETMTYEEIIKAIKDSEYNEDNLSAEDGYNLEAYTYTVKEITEEQAKQYKEIINQYEKI